MGLILLIGLKHSGKSSVGRILARELGLPFRDLDDDVVDLCPGATSAREVFRAVGRDAFMALEAQAAKTIATSMARGVVAAGGGTIDNREAFQPLASVSYVVFIDVAVEVLVERVFRHGIPAFVDPERPEEHFREVCRRRRAACFEASDSTIEAGEASTSVVAAIIKTRMQELDSAW